MVGTYNITILQGSDKTISLVLKDDDGVVINLTGYTAAMHVRTNPKSAVLLDELTTENSRIVITGVSGKIDLKFPNVVTSEYGFVKAVYDLELYSGGVVSRVIEGSFLVSLEVTRQ
jgi:hypothetical protein